MANITVLVLFIFVFMIVKDSDGATQTVSYSTKSVDGTMKTAVQQATLVSQVYESETTGSVTFTITGCNDAYVVLSTGTSASDNRYVFTYQENNAYTTNIYVWPSGGSPTSVYSRTFGANIIFCSQTKTYTIEWNAESLMYYRETTLMGKYTKAENWGVTPYILIGSNANIEWTFTYDDTKIPKQTTVPNVVTTVPDIVTTVPETTVPDVVTTVPDVASTVPDVVTTVPDVVTTVPDVVTTVPDVVTTVPDVVTTVPDVVTTVPDVVTTVPDVVTTVPDVASTVPDVVTTVPDVVTTVPDVVTTVPNVVTTVPDVVTTVPDAVTTVPGVVTTVPDVVTTVPDVATTVPDVVTTVPDVVTTVPDVVTTVPDVVTTVPDVVTTVPDVVTTEPDIATIVPDVVTTVPDIAATVPDVVTSIPDTNAPGEITTDSIVPDIITTVNNIATMGQETAGLVTTVPDPVTTIPDIFTLIPAIASTIPDDAASVSDMSSGSHTTAQLLPQTLFPGGSNTLEASVAASSGDLLATSQNTALPVDISTSDLQTSGSYDITGDHTSAVNTQDGPSTTNTVSSSPDTKQSTARNIYSTYFSTEDSTFSLSTSLDESPGTTGIPGMVPLEEEDAVNETFTGINMGGITMCPSTYYKVGAKTILIPRTITDFYLTIECPVGYQFPDGTTKRTMVCLTSGRWHQSTPDCKRVACPQLIPGERTSINSLEHSYMDSVQIECNSTENETRLKNGLSQSPVICTAHSKWMSTVPKCYGLHPKPAPYHSLASMTLGLTNGPDHTAKYTCFLGYRFFDGSKHWTLETNTMGQWVTEEIPACKLTTCPPVPEIQNTTANSSIAVYGSVVLFTCNYGYALPGGLLKEAITCTENGTWNATPSACLEIFCQQPPTLSHAIVTFEDQSFESITQYTCVGPKRFDNGHISTNITCQADSQWSPLVMTCGTGRCQPIPVFPNAWVSSDNATDGSTVVVTCNEGYEFPDASSNKSLTCSNLEWVPTDLPRCQVSHCSSPPPLLHGSASHYETAYGSTITYTCDNGYILSTGNQTQQITCTSTKTWNTELLPCEGVKCPPAPVVLQSSQNTDRNSYGTTIHYTCMEGHLFSTGGSSINITCQVDGSWTYIPTDCKLIHCKPIPHWEGLVPSSKLTAYKSVVNYSCSDGLILEDRSNHTTTQCEGIGIWNPPLMACTDNTEPVAAPPPDEAPSSEVIGTISVIVMGSMAGLIALSDIMSFTLQCAAKCRH